MSHRLTFVFGHGMTKDRQARMTEVARTTPRGLRTLIINQLRTPECAAAIRQALTQDPTAALVVGLSIDGEDAARAYAQSLIGEEFAREAQYVRVFPGPAASPLGI